MSKVLEIVDISYLCRYSIRSTFPILSILHACVIDWGSDYVLKPPKDFDPLPRWGGGGYDAESRACRALVAFCWLS